MATLSTTRSPPTDIDPASSSSPGANSAKRQKVTRACDSCKSRKRRCSGQLPCKVCLASGATCTYLASYTRGRLVQPQAVGGSYNHSSGAEPANHAHARNTLLHPVAEDEGHCRLSRAVSPDAGGSAFTGGQYSGPTSSYTFLRRAWKRFSHNDSSAQGLSQSVPEESMPPDHVSIFKFGDKLAPQLDAEDFRLPERETGISLVNQYFDLAMPTYRFFHQPTVIQWLEAYYRQEETETDLELLIPVRQASVLMVLATAWVFNVMNQDRQIPVQANDTWRESDRMFSIAQGKLQAETGRPRLESVQARLASVLYLLQVSRPNQAYYLFGTTLQLAMSIGLHRAAVGLTGQQDRISRECRKRTFWVVSTVDTYLCCILGKPPLIHLDDVDQVFPEAIDDEDLIETADFPTNGQHPRDSIIKASILHVQIARIVKKSFREQYSVHRKTADHKLRSVTKLNAEIKAWHESIPIILSGTIHPSSLIPVFRRQVAVLKLAHSHALMLINRPSCLLEATQAEVQQSQIDTCISAAKTTFDIVSAASLSKHNILWYTAYVTFNALSIVYVYLIERKPGNRLYLTPPEYDPEDLLRQAETVQKHLIESTRGNAPSLRYGVILEELLQEVKNGKGRSASNRPPQPSAGPDSSTDTGSTHFAHASTESCSTNVHDLTSCTSDMMDAFANFPTDEELWFALDSLPFSDFGQVG